MQLSENTADRRIRDSKSPHLGHIALTGPAFAAMVADVKAGRYDL